MSNFSNENVYSDIVEATLDEANFTFNNIVEFNENRVPSMQRDNRIFKNYVIKEKGVIIAGINTCLYWDCLYIDVLFIDENYRERKLGSRLLEYVEQEAKKLGAGLVYLNTFDFQAKDFYCKHGYEIFGVLNNCPKGHKRYYLTKNLDN